MNLAFGITFASVLFVVGCSSSKDVAVAKSGAQLWGENCVRCHNAPSPTAFSDYQWETIGQHMRIRANLTAMETDKIVDFLKMAN
ncbi:MAG: cytochrome c [Chlorobi bacterium]|nr:cytochrome c [Chlorobiota bacterium]